MSVAFNSLYSRSNYVVPISSPSLVRINGIDIRAFGLELTQMPDLVLPPTQQRNYNVQNQDGSVTLRDSYSNWSFSLGTQVSGLDQSDLYQKKTEFFRWLQTQSNNFIGGVRSKEITGLMFEFVPHNTFYDTGTISTPSAASTTVNGTGTKFKSYASPGATFEISGDTTRYTVSQVVSDTQLILSSGVSSQQTSKSYRLERRRYLIVNYDGSGSNSPLSDRGFLRNPKFNSTTNAFAAEDISVGFYTVYPYWVGDVFNYKESAIASNNGSYTNDEYGGKFIELHGAGTADIHPEIAFTGEVSSPKVINSVHSFVSNFDGDTKAKTLYNEAKAVPTTTTKKYLYFDHISDSGKKSLRISKNSGGTVYGTALINTRSDSYTPSAGTADVSPVINYKRGHLSVRVKPYFASSSGTQHYIVDFGTGNNLRIYFDGTDNKFKASIGSLVASVSGTTLVSGDSNDWFNIQAQWIKGDKLRITVSYLDVSTGSTAITLTLTDNPDTQFSIGHDISNAYHFDGLIEDLGIWSIDLDSDDESLLQGSTTVPRIPANRIATQALLLYASTDDDGLTASIYQDTRYDIDTTPTETNESDRLFQIDTVQSRLTSAPTSNEEFLVDDKVLIYDDLGNQTHAKVTTVTDGDTLTVQKDDFSSNQVTTVNGYPRVQDYPDPDQIGSFAQFEGIDNGKFFRSQSIMQFPNSSYEPNIGISFWARLETSKTASYGALTSDDRAYAIHKFRHGAGIADNRGWGIAFDDNWKMRFVTSGLDITSETFDSLQDSGAVPTTATDGAKVIASFAASNFDEDFYLQSITMNFEGQASDYYYTGEDIKIQVLPGDEIASATTIFSKQVEFGNDNTIDTSITFTPEGAQLFDRTDSFRIVYDNPVTSYRVFVNLSYRSTTRLAKITSQVSTDAGFIHESMNDDKWHHYCWLVENISNDTSPNFEEEIVGTFKLRLFIDGTEVVPVTPTNINYVNLSGGDSSHLLGDYLLVGRNLEDNFTFPGSISDVRLWQSSGDGINNSGKFIGTDSEIKTAITKLRHSANSETVTFENGSSTFAEAHWWKFNDGTNALRFDYQNQANESDESLLQHDSLTSFSSTFTLKKTESYITTNLISGAWELNSSNDGWVASGRYDSSQPYDDFVNGVSLFDRVTSSTEVINATTYDIDPIRSTHMIKLGSSISDNSTTQYGISKVLTIYEDGVTDSSTEYVLRFWSWKNNTGTLTAKAESFNPSALSNSKTLLTSINSTSLRGWEFNELSFHNTNTNARAILISLLADDNSDTTYISGISLHKNLITNGGFIASTASVPDDWNYLALNSLQNHATFADTSTEHSGTNAVQMTASDTQARGIRSANFSMESGRHYEISFWARKYSSSSDEILSVFINDTDSSGTLRVHLFTVFDLGTTYKRYSTVYKATNTSSYAYVGFRNNVVGSVNIDDVSVIKRHQVAFSKTVNTEAFTPSLNATAHGYGISTSKEDTFIYDDIVGNKNEGAFAIRFKPNFSSTVNPRTNILVNGDFEDGIGLSTSDEFIYGWNSTGTVNLSNTIYNGTYSAKIDNGTLYQGDIGNFTHCRFSTYVYCESGTELTIEFGPTNVSGENVIQNNYTYYSQVVTETGKWVHVTDVLDHYQGNGFPVEGNSAIKFTTTGVAYIDNVRLAEVNEYEDSMTLFSWIGDDAGSIKSDDYVRLIYNPDFGFSFQSSKTASQTLAITDIGIGGGKLSFSANDLVDVSGWWNKDGVLDDKDGITYYGKLLFNGYVIGSITSDISSLIPSYNLKNLFIGGQGTSATQSSHPFTGVIDSLSLFPRSMSDEDLRGLFVKNEKFKNFNTSFSSTQATGDDDILRYDFSRNNSSYYKHSDNNLQKSVLQGITKVSVNQDKALLYLKAGNTTDNLDISYRPHFR